MALILGIDTGGTNTDAVLLDDESGIIQSAKALTTKHDLSVGIRHAVESVLPDSPSEIKLVSMSTTLATNAIVEGQGSPICLLLIGYDPLLLHNVGLEKILARESIVFISGGHNVNGDEHIPLNVDDAKKAISAHAPSVAAFAVSGYFSVRNPSHELRIKELIQELTGLPVTCGHELSSKLNAPRRALTAALNARIIPLICSLIDAVQDTMAEKGIGAPLMIVKGDGSLMDAQMAMNRPVETILSGPAASVVGARYLSNAKDGFIVDMGGTTTDIAVLQESRPTLNLDGATVGEWKTMVEAIDVWTTGLGGDSEVVLNEMDLNVGPKRVIPLSVLANENARVCKVLEDQLTSIRGGDERFGCENMGHFVMRQQQLPDNHLNFSSDHGKIWKLLDKGPLAFTELFEFFEYPSICRQYIGELVERGLLVLSAFTPTDAAHVLGHYEYGAVKAAELGAALLAMQMKMSARQFCEQVEQQVMVQIGRSVINSMISKEKIPIENGDAVGQLLIDRALKGDNGSEFSVKISIKHPLIAIGAPVKTYFPTVAKKLGTTLFISEHAGVGNAVGAAVGSILQTVRALVRPLAWRRVYRTYLPSGVYDFPAYEEALAYAEKSACEMAKDHARRAGASLVKVHVEQYNRVMVLEADGETSEDVYETEIIATAVGRPRLGN